MSAALTTTGPEARKTRPPAPVFHTVPAVAVMVGKSERTLRNMIAAGRGPRVTTIGRSKRIRDDHLLEWLDGRAA